MVRRFVLALALRLSTPGPRTLQVLRVFSLLVHLFSHTDLIKSRLNLESRTNNEKTRNTCSVRGPGVDKRRASASTKRRTIYRRSGMGHHNGENKARDER